MSIRKTMSISTLTVSYATIPTAANPIEMRTTRIEAKVILEGLTFSSCAQSVTNAALTLTLKDNSEDDCIDNNKDTMVIIDKDSVRVSLFPQSQLYL